MSKISAIEIHISVLEKPSLTKVLNVAWSKQKIIIFNKI